MHTPFGLSLVRIVNRMRKVDIVLCRPDRLLNRVCAVRNKLAVRVENRVGPQARRQHVRPHLRDLQKLRAEVEIPLHQKLDGLVDRQSVGRALDPPPWAAPWCHNAWVAEPEPACGAVIPCARCGP